MSDIEVPSSSSAAGSGRFARFDPGVLGLSADFRLSDFADEIAIPAGSLCRLFRSPDGDPLRVACREMGVAGRGPSGGVTVRPGVERKQDVAGLPPRAGHPVVQEDGLGEIDESADAEDAQPGPLGAILDGDAPSGCNGAEIGHPEVNHNSSVSLLGSGRWGDHLTVQSHHVCHAFCDDPYLFGRIACAGLLGHLYALGVTDADGVLVWLTVAQRMTGPQRDAVLPCVLNGFKRGCEDAGARLTGGQTVLNPWLTVGGVATAACAPDEVIQTCNAIAGDLLVLTKPLGTRAAVELHQRRPARWRQQLERVATEADVERAHQRALDAMCRLNQAAACLMHKHDAHGATCVGRHGLLWGAGNLAGKQRGAVSFQIHSLPVIAKVALMDEACGRVFGIESGLSSEPSGGLFVCLSKESATEFCRELMEVEGHEAWIVGLVERGDRTARIVTEPRIIEVPEQDSDSGVW